MRQKIIATNNHNFIILNVLKLITHYTISYNIHKSFNDRTELTFNVTKKSNGAEINDLIFFFITDNTLYIESFFPNLNLQKDSKGLSAALAYLLMAFYGAHLKNKPIQKIMLRAKKHVAKNFWMKFKDLKLIERGRSPLDKDYYEYTGIFPESTIKELYRIAVTNIKKSPTQHPFLKPKPN